MQAKLCPSESLRLAFGHYEVEKPLGLPVKSLSLHHSREVYDIDYLNSLFSIPTLRWLNISGLLRSFTLLREDDIDRSRRSATNKLSFPSSTPSANDFAEILTWPKALKEFGFEAWPDDRPAPSPGEASADVAQPPEGNLEEDFPFRGTSPSILGLPSPL